MRAKKMEFGERRLYARKACMFTVDINDYSRSYACHLRNLSVGGALLDPPSHFMPEMGQTLILSISFRNKRGTVTVKAQVIRSQPGHLAVAFEKSLASTLHQAN